MNENEIQLYNNERTIELKSICEVLMNEVDVHLADATSKLYHGSPVWFIEDNPIVGYDATADHVNILFWSGQSFIAPGLEAAGKFKAAGTKYFDVSEIDLEALRAWLKESVATQWNYRDLRKNNGELVRW